MAGIFWKGPRTGLILTGTTSDCGNLRIPLRPTCIISHRFELWCSHCLLPSAWNIINFVHSCSSASVLHYTRWKGEKGYRNLVHSMWKDQSLKDFNWPLNQPPILVSMDFSVGSEHGNLITKNVFYIQPLNIRVHNQIWIWAHKKILMYFLTVLRLLHIMSFTGRDKFYLFANSLVINGCFRTGFPPYLITNKNT